jgi:outer membrane receptor protein involved in Fe transport
LIFVLFLKGELKVVARKSKQQDLDPQARRSAVSHAVRTQIQARPKQYLAAALVSGALVMPQLAPAQDLMIEEIIVTAQKREQNLQDVPIAVTAFDSTAITQQGMASFADLALMVPNLSYKTTAYQGPTIVMRGAADGGDGNPSGQSPSVAVYLDEQPVSFIGGQLDIHIYDMERIEALAGPQGTLYGASSQTGTLRYITNKPNSDAFEAGFDVQAMGTKDGAPGGSIEGFVNFPIGENAAIRLVGWYLEEGGWIDNVPTSAAFAAGPSQNTPGQYEYPLKGPDTTVINTSDAFAEDDFNELTRAGLRAALRVDLNENWTGTVGVNWSDTDTEGVWEHAPSLVGEGNIQRYSVDSWDEEWTQASLTIEGEFSNHSLVYAGAFMDRDTDYNQGYNAYGEYATFVNFYACDYSAGPTDCSSLEEQGIYPINTERSSHELRLLSLADSRLHYTVGLFTEVIESDIELNFFQPGMTPAYAVDGDSLYFRTDQVRENKQTAVFGEVSYDISDSVTILGGVRWFDEEETIVGVVGYGIDAGTGTDTILNSKFTNDDQIFKANITWRVSDDALLYATWSEGYRPGGVNREPSFQGTSVEQYTPDKMTNYEIGWKTTLADGRVRFNGAAYFMDWEDVQYTIYQFGVSACCGNTYNLETAEVAGVEFDLTWRINDKWMASLAAAYNDAETTADFILPPDTGSTSPFQVPNGTPLPNVPEIKANVVLRYDSDLRPNLPGYAQLTWTYVDDTTSEIVPASAFPQDSYTIANLRAGVSKGSWGVDLFVDNLTDERADLYIHPRSYALTTTTNRPLNYGVRYWARFE